MIYKIFTGCYIVAALVLVAACNDGLDIQTKYLFTVETMPVPKELKVNETAEIRCELKREGRWEDTRYTIRWFLFDGEGTLKLDDGTALLPNDRYPLEKETFRLYFHPAVGRAEQLHRLGGGLGRSGGRAGIRLQCGQRQGGRGWKWNWERVRCRLWRN